MKKLLLLSLLFPTLAFANIRVISEVPRTVTIYQKQCELKQVLVDNQTRNGILGGLLGAAIGTQIGGGSGRDIATVVGAISGSNIARSRTQERLEYRNICTEVPVTIEAGKIVTFEYNGTVFTQIIE